MELTDLPLPPEIWAATPYAAQTLIVAQGERIRELEARLGQDSSNSSRPPSSDPPHAPAKRRAAHGGGGVAGWPVSVEPPGSAPVAAGPVGGPGVPGRGGAPGAGAECRPGTHCRGGPGRSAAGGRGQHGRNGLAAGAAARLA